MELNGKIIFILPAQSGVSQKSGNSWMTQTYVLETEGQYPKKVPFEVFGEDRIKQFNIQLGDEATIQFDIEGSEYQGKWYTRIKCYNYTKKGLFANVQQPQPQPTVIYPDRPQPAPQPQPQQNNDASDLPF